MAKEISVFYHGRVSSEVTQEALDYLEAMLSDKKLAEAKAKAQRRSEGELGI